MTTTPGYEGSTDHTSCKRDKDALETKLEGSLRDKAALETKLQDSLKTIADKDRVIKDQDAKIKSLKDGKGTGRETSWIGDVIDRTGEFLTMLDKKKYGPAVEYGLSIVAGSLIGYSMK